MKGLEYKAGKKKIDFILSVLCSKPLTFDPHYLIGSKPSIHSTPLPFQFLFPPYSYVFSMVQINMTLMFHE